MEDSPPVSEPNPPIAPRRPTVLTAHGEARTDDWYWLRDRDDPAVVAHLTAENAYTEAVLAPLAALRDRLFEEIRGRVKETDVGAPVRHGPYEYLVHTVEGLQYPIHTRRPRGGGDEAWVLDVNRLAEGHEFCTVTGFEVSPDQRLLAFAVDTDGGEISTLRFRDLGTGVDLPDVVEGVYYGLAWADDGRTVFYVRPDEAVRPYQVWRHTLGTPVADDVLVYEEPDERFFVDVSRARSGRFVLVGVHSKTTSEMWFLPSAAPGTALRVVEPREDGVEYEIEPYVAPDRADRFWVLGNAGGAKNFALWSTPAAQPGREHWTLVVPAQPGVRLASVDAFAGHAVLTERAEAVERLRVLRLAGDGDDPSGDIVAAQHLVEVPEAVATQWVGANPEFGTTTLRLGYSTLAVPPADCDYDLDTRELSVVKRQPVLGGYDPDRYVTAREWAVASDGTRIPISLVYPRDLVLDGRAPMLLYGYGAYEISTDPVFRSTRVSLLERGFVYAIAHVRGGGELGREWYEQGRLDHKPNSFTDFVACAEHLIDRGFTSADRLVARGGSAGGLLMGAVTNLRPDLFAAVVAEVPFVDVLTTMQDASLPLTVTEWEEWGNPDDPDVYTLIRSYSPYDNVGPRDYPHLLVTAGLNDPRVQYWEPAKWVAKLRATKQGERRVLLKTEMGAGHRGPSGRYDLWRDEAFVLAFVCDCAGAVARA